MELSTLQYFREVARLGNITAAARKLGLTQPTLSIAIQHLEKELGAVLLLRHRGGVTLTDAGESLLSHADEVFALLERAAVTIADLGSDLVGHYVLGCNESLGAYFLPRLLPGLLREAPRLGLAVHNANSAAVLAAVVEREIPFGLVVNPEPHPDLVHLRLFRDAVDFFVRREGAPAPGAEPGHGPEDCATQDLAEAHRRLRIGPLVYADRVPQCTHLLEQISQSVTPQRLLSCGDFELIRSLAVSGVGVAMLPRRIAAHANRGALQRLHPALPWFPDEIVLVYRGDLPKTRAALFIKDAVVRCARSMPAVDL